MKTKLSLLLPMLLLLAIASLAAEPARGGGIWIRNAYYGEGHTFDKCLGHQPGNGAYHHHAHPICLRAQLNDNLTVVVNSRNGTTYKENPAPWKHSPILGWSYDGYPIYGPYGFSDATSASSPVKRIKSGFRLRSISDRTTLATWALAHHPGIPQTLASTQYGPAISDVYPLGRYVEDFEWVTGVGDLDQYNGRFAVTPEYPTGTYAYYTTINDDGSPAFPYILGMQYYGTVTGNGTTDAPTGATSYFANGAYAQTLPNAPQLNSWYTKGSQQDARVISGFDPSAGAKTTWPSASDVPTGGTAGTGQTTPAKADTQTISYTDTTVYMTTTSLASYAMGPWFLDGSTNGGVFPGWPRNQNIRGNFPRTTSVAATKTNTPLGADGLWINGVGVYNVLDGSSYSTAAGMDAGNPVANVRSSVHVSSASFDGGPTAQGAYVTAFSLFGAQLATSSVGASSADWPTSLGGATVSIRDVAGTTHAAQILFASPSQVNYRVPEAAATGVATVTVTVNGVTVPGALNITTVYPNLFYHFNGEVTASAYIVRVRNGVQTVESIVRTVNGNAVPVPIELGPATDQVYLVLFGTGLGKAGAVTSSSASIGGVSVTPIYAGPQGTWGGLDQYNMLIPRSLAGRGKVDVTTTANGKVSNTVTIVIN